MSAFLKTRGYKNISVGDMHLAGLKYAQNYGIKKCYQFNLLKTPFKDAFDVTCMFDVLEHIEDDNLALTNVNRMLKKGGKLVLTVPSHMWLWNRDDAIAGHKIRYTKGDLEARLKDNGFDIQVSRYFFISIVPLLLLRTRLSKDTGFSVQDSEYEKDLTLNSMINNILLFISRMENKLNKFLPNFCGGSLFIIARKI